MVPYIVIDVRCPRCGSAATFAPSAEVKLRHTPKHLKINYWQHPGTWGVCQCDRCVSRFDHLLRWPADAWWAVAVAEGVLWAYTRAHAAALLAYIDAERRHPAARPPFYWYLFRVPKRFLASTRRRRIARALRNLLRDGPAHAAARRRGRRPAAR